MMIPINEPLPPMHPSCKRFLDCWAKAWADCPPQLNDAKIPYFEPRPREHVLVHPTCRTANFLRLITTIASSAGGEAEAKLLRDVEKVLQCSITLEHVTGGAQ